jgi:hypothetical protein
LAPDRMPAWVGPSFVIRSVLGAEAGSETSLHVQYILSSMSSDKADVNLLAIFIHSKQGSGLIRSRALFIFVVSKLGAVDKKEIEAD